MAATGEICKPMKRVYLCGIGGIGMANVAALLKQGGFEVSGSDANVYEPAASILREAGVMPRTPYRAENVPTDGTPVIIGNALSRGHVEVEAALDAAVPVFSFPEFLCRHVLPGRHTLVVVGTHGKSTTTACLAHILHTTGHTPGFLVGAQPLDFSAGAAWGREEGPFVIEGDEYDSAFFDKRSKFLHYFPRTLLLGRVEYDHADIFPSLPEMLLA
jgi:UDP-N-acetylmuramate: L-alanyl-gamma-D-glutamyl-meso-diaminopimelate ligase